MWHSRLSSGQDSRRAIRLKVLLFCAFVLGFIQQGAAQEQSNLTIYQRSQNPPALPGRPAEKEVQAILQSLRQEEASTESNLRAVALRFSRDFDSFESAYNRERGSKPLLEIQALKQKLGPGIVPHDEDEVTAIKRAFADCLNVAHARSTHSGDGREVGPGGNSNDYVRTFLTGDINDVFRARTTELQAAYKSIEPIVLSMKVIVITETALDQGNYARALEGYDAIPSPSAYPYLKLSEAFHSDLRAWMKAKTTTVDDQGQLSAQAKSVGAEGKQLALSSSSEMPMTTALLSERLFADKGTLLTKLNALQAFSPPEGPNISVVQANERSISEAVERVQELKQSVGASMQLSDLIDDKDATEAIRTLYGDEIWSSIMKKGRGLQAAETQIASLERDIERVKQTLRDQPKFVTIRVLSTRIVVVTEHDANGYERRKPQYFQRVIVAVGRAGASDGIVFNYQNFSGNGATADLLCLEACETLHVGDVRHFVTSHYIGHGSVPYLTSPSAPNGVGGWQILELCAGAPGNRCTAVSTVNDR